MKEKENNFGIVTLTVATLLIIIQCILVDATVIPQFAENPTRYYLYNFMKAISIIGLNLIPLFLGYYAHIFRKKDVLKKLGNFYLIFFTSAMICNIFIYMLREQLNIRDFWLVFFPISQNYFTYATSCMLGLLLIPITMKYLDSVENRKLKTWVVITSVLFLVLPTLFGKGLWSFQEGENIVWIFYLIFLGYFLQRFDISKKIQHNYFHVLFSLMLLLLSIVLMTNVSLIVRGNTSTAFRFCVPFSLVAMYFTISLFTLLENKLQKSVRLKVPGQWLATFLISMQIVTNWPLIRYVISSYYKKDFPNSGSQWLLRIFLFVLLYLLSSLCLFVISLLLQKIPFYCRLENHLSFSDEQQFMKKIDGIRRWFYSQRKIIFVATFFYFFTFIQFLLISLDGMNVLNRIIILLTKNQATIILTVWIIMMFYLLLYLLTNRFWYSFIATLIIDVLLTISTILKIKLREEPILPSDLKMLSGFNEILDMINPVIIFGTLGILLFLMVSMILIQRKAKEIYFLKINMKKRLSMVFVIFLFFSGVFFINHKNSPSYLLVNLFKVNKTFFNQKEAVKSNGPLLQFLINVDVKIMEKPQGYSQEKIREVMKKYNIVADKINTTRGVWNSEQTIIFCLSESFSDPRRVPNLTIEGNPIPNIQGLKKETTSGLMMSVGYGGGTANMEWEGLTGLDISNLSETLVTPYNQLVDQQAVSPNITNLFQESIAIHPFTASLYNRKSVFEKFGFQKFYYDGSSNKLEYTDKIDNSPRVSDESAFNETLKHIKESSDETQFIQLSTMQNHMPYENYYDTNDFNFTGDAVQSSREQELKTYMQGIHYTDKALKKFLAELDKIDKPITFVFYGDHLPSLYSGLNMSQYGLELHETDYFIYSNQYSREQSKKVSKKVVSTSDFPAMALEQANVKVTPYYALLTRVNELPATTIDPYNSVSNRVNGSQVFVTEENKLLTKKDLTKKQMEILEDYKLIQYDLTAGRQYSAKWATQNYN